MRTAGQGIPHWLRFLPASDRAASSWYIGAGFFFAPALALASLHHRDTRRRLALDHRLPGDTCCGQVGVHVGTLATSVTKRAGRENTLL